MYQTHRDKGDHFLHRGLQLHLAGKRHRFLQALDRHLTGLPGINGEHHQLPVQADPPIQGPCIHAPQADVLPQKSVDIRLISRKGQHLPDPERILPPGA